MLSLFPVFIIGFCWDYRRGNWERNCRQHSNTKKCQFLNNKFDTKTHKDQRPLPVIVYVYILDMIILAIEDVSIRWSTGDFWGQN
jgi:hypothetical protein